jgi:hypothetical protein
MKAKVGFFQELQRDGSVGNSFMRMLEMFFFGLLIVFLFFSFRSYKSSLALYTKLLEERSISEQSFNVLALQTKVIDWNVLLLLVTATVAPKVIQKFAESKTGGKDSMETITKTSLSEQEVKTGG